MDLDNPREFHGIKIGSSLTEKLPDICVGLLIVTNLTNSPDHTLLKKARLELEEELRVSYKGMDRKQIRELPVFAAYDNFYRSFRKTYHVQLQLESIAHKDKSVFSPSSLVGAMFMAELKSGLLTAAHDLTVLEFPLTLDIARGDESYQRMDGGQQVLKEGDLFIRDLKGVISSVIYGPDKRTRILADTDQAVYTTYGLPGISRAQVQEELELLEGYIQLFAPQSKRDLLAVFGN